MENTLQTHLQAADNSLKFQGNAGYQINGNRILINIDAIHNQRFDNISGTVSIELWALNAPYQGGDFSGVALAGTQIGELLGQHYLQQCSYDLNYQAPEAGTWYLCLMLREWDNGSFVTRDVVNFATPYIVDAPARSNVAVSHDDKSNVITVDFIEKVSDSLSFVSAKKEPQDRVKESTDAKSKSKAEVAKTVTKAKSKAKPASKPKKAEIAEEPVSINKATLADLENIKGLSKKVAKSIEEGRPYKKLEDLLNVKGMGKKLLEKIAKLIKL
jgi:competence ComEA-like helix-hairpin-helix protein